MQAAYLLTILTGKENKTEESKSQSLQNLEARNFLAFPLKLLLV